MRRSIRFYRNNERQVMRALGLRPTKNSGAGWVEKEDGESDKLLCQLKSTDAASIRINYDDIKKLRVHALQAHKVPVFAIQFLQSDDILLCIAPNDIGAVSDALESVDFDVDGGAITDWVGRSTDWDEPTDTGAWDAPKAVKSDRAAREAYRAEMEKSKAKKDKAAK